MVCDFLGKGKENTNDDDSSAAVAFRCAVSSFVVLFVRGKRRNVCTQRDNGGTFGVQCNDLERPCRRICFEAGEEWSGVP